MTFGERIKNLRSEHNLSLYKAAFELDISPAALSRYESGMYEPKSLSVVSAIADLYHVSTDYLLGKSSYRNIEEFLAEKYNGTLQDKIEKTLEYMQNNSIETMFMIPLYSKITNEKNISRFLQGYIPVSPTLYKMDNPENYFYLLVQDSVINLKVKNGDFALIKKQDNAIDGDIVLISIDNGEPILRKWKKLNEQLILLEPQSDVQIFEPILLDFQKNDFKILGKVIGHFGKI